jgi:hypothetical protein
MPLKLISTAAGTTADYAKYVYQPNPVKTDRMNEPTTLDFSLVNFDAGFVKLVRGNYIKAYSTIYGGENLLLWSEDFTNGIWNASNLTIIPNATTAPDGTLSADKIQVVASSTALLNQTIAGAGNAGGNTYTIYVKQGSGVTDGNSFVLRNVTTATNLASITLNYSTGVITQSIGSGATATSAANGFWRLTIPAPTGISQGNSIAVYVGFVGGTETAGEFLFAWGAQLETGTTASIYTKTTSSASSPWFTGYVINDPEPVYLGTKAGVQQFCYNYKAVSDEYILNLETIGIIPPFINTDMGTVIKTLVNQLCPGIFDVTGVGAGLPIARLVVDPTFKFIDVVSRFTDGANHRFFGHDHKLFFLPQDSVASGLTVDGSSKHFTPSSLSMKVSSDPVINDAVVLGNIEPQQYMNEYFVSDGLTGSYPLASAIFGVDSSVFLDDDFSASTIDTTKWNYFDTSNTFLQVSNGYLNCLGGNNNNAFDVMLQSVALIPLEGNLSMTHGEWDFLNNASRGVNGVIGGMWTQTPNSALTGCFSGLRVFNQTNLIPDSDEVSGSTFWTQDASMPIVNGVGAIRGNGWQYTGTGAVSAFHFNRSATITVTASTTYTISGYINATSVTAGNPTMGVYDTTISTAYGSVAQTAGVNGRVSVTFTTPVGVTQVKVIFDTSNCTVTTGAKLTFSNPQLELGSTATAYETNNTGAMDTRLVPIVNGVLDRSQWQVVDFTKRYIIKTVTNVVKIHRRILRFSYINAAGVVVNNGGTAYTDVAVIATVLSEVDPATGALTNQTFFYNTTALTSNQTWGIYVPLVSNDLHATVTGITVNSPLNAMLELAAPNTLTWKQSFIGPNQMDALDGVTPIATITDANSGAQTSSSLLGNSQYNPGQATLQFFKNSANQTTTVPSVGTFMHLRYRRPGAAIARITDTTSQGIEASAWGDSGLRSSIRKDLQPVPRNSEECAWAAQAIVGDNNYQHYEGNYKQYSDFCTSEPQSGQILKFSNLPTGLPSVLQAEELNEVKTTFLSTRPERFLHEVTFGKVDRLKRFLAHSYAQSDTFQIVDTTETPAAIPWTSVGTAFAPDVIAPTLTSWDASNYNFNTNQAPPGLSPNLLLWTEDYTNAVWSKANATITANATTDPIGGSTADAVAYSATGTGSTLQQFLPAPSVAVANQTFTLSGWVKVASGTPTLNLLIEDQSFNVIANQSFTITSAWQRFSVTGTALSTATGLRAFFYNPNTATTYFIWGTQLELGSSATAYVSQAGSFVYNGGFEVRYTDESWGSDAGKNLVTRTTGSTQTFAVPRNTRGKVCFAKAFDMRNKLLWSEDITNAAWQKLNGVPAPTVANATALNPDGDMSQISTVTFSAASNAEVFQNSVWPCTGATAVFSVSLKGTAGQKVRVRLECEAAPFSGTNVDVTFTGQWQRVSVSTTGAGTQLGTFFPIISNAVDSLAKSFQMTRASLEINTTSETVYCKTNGTAYGAVSQFASGVKVGFPLIPATPSATIDASDPLHPIVNVGLPVVMADVWGIEIRASNNSTVLYHRDLTDSGYLAAVIADNSIIKARNLSYFVYTYNLLGEYSTAYNATLTMPTPAITAFVMDEPMSRLEWATSNAQNVTSYVLEMNPGSSYNAADPLYTSSSSGTIALYSGQVAGSSFFNAWHFRITPFDAMGAGTAMDLNHSYTATGVVEFNGNEVAVIPAPATPTTDPVVPTPLSDYPTAVIGAGWRNYGTNSRRPLPL